jgi:hypothetical protein
LWSQTKRNTNYCVPFFVGFLMLRRFVLVTGGTVRNNVALRYTTLTCATAWTNPSASSKTCHSLLQNQCCFSLKFHLFWKTQILSPIKTVSFFSKLLLILENTKTLLNKGK